MCCSPTGLLDGDELWSNVPQFPCLCRWCNCKALRSAERINVSFAWTKSTMSTNIFAIEKLILFHDVFQLLITESLRQERPLRSSSPAFDQSPPCQLDHSTKCHAQLFFGHLEGWQLYHHPGQRIQMLKKSSSEVLLEVMFCSFAVLPIRGVRRHQHGVLFASCDP